MKKIFSPLKKLRQKIGKWFWLIIVILLVGVGIFISSGSKKNAQIVTTTVQKGMVKEELVLSGSVKADKHVILYFPAGGKINGVYVKEGDWVKKGQALVSVDRTILNSSYQQALNNYRNYQAAAENVLDSVRVIRLMRLMPKKRPEPLPKLPETMLLMQLPQLSIILEMPHFMLPLLVL
jgi:multidrug efflux pump subunit AcrA (membrane-fusion protein)